MVAMYEKARQEEDQGTYSGALAGRNRPYPSPSTTWQPITITKVANGFLLQVGCRTFIAKTWLEVSTLAEYWVDPYQTGHK